MELSYKCDQDDYIGSVKRQILETDDNQEIIKEFNGKYFNLKNTFQLDHNAFNYTSTLIGFIRSLAFFLNEKMQFLTNFFIEREIVENLLIILNSKEDYVTPDLQSEALNLLNYLIVLIDMDDPLSIFEGNEELLLNILSNLVKIDYDKFNKKILNFLTLLYNGTEKSIEFVFTILSLEDIQNLIEDRAITYDTEISKLIKKFTQFSIPTDKIGIVFNIIKSIFAKGPSNSFLFCIESLTKIVCYVHDETIEEEDKENIKKLFEQDNDLSNYFIESLKIDDDRIPSSVFIFISEFCRAKFDIKKYERLFNEAYEALDKHSDKYPKKIEIRCNAAKVFGNVFYFNFNNNPFLLENALKYADRLSKVVEDDAYEVAKIASYGILIISICMPPNKLEKMISSESFFFILKRILEFEVPLQLFIEATRNLFDFAEKFQHLKFFVDKFIEYQIIDGLIENKEKSINEDEVAIVDQFLMDFENTKENI